MHNNDEINEAIQHFKLTKKDQQLLVAGATLMTVATAAMATTTNAYDDTVKDNHVKTEQVNKVNNNVNNGWHANSVAQIKQAIQKQGGNVNTIQYGDTLGAIAQAMNINMTTLQQINHIANANVIIAGNKIGFSADHQNVQVMNNQGKVIAQAPPTPTPVVNQAVTTPVAHPATPATVAHITTVNQPVQQTVTKTVPVQQTVTKEVPVTTTVNKTQTVTKQVPTTTTDASGKQITTTKPVTTTGTVNKPVTTTTTTQTPNSNSSSSATTATTAPVTNSSSSSQLSNGYTPQQPSTSSSANSSSSVSSNSSSNASSSSQASQSSASSSSMSNGYTPQTNSSSASSSSANEVTRPQVNEYVNGKCDNDGLINYFTADAAWWDKQLNAHALDSNNSDDMNLFRQECLRDINLIRQENGLGNVTEDDFLDKAAQSHANYMASVNEDIHDFIGSDGQCTGQDVTR